jgi:hypothetical protein
VKEELLKRLLNNQCSPEEIKEIEKLLNNPKDKKEIDSLLDQKWKEHQIKMYPNFVYENILLKINEKISQRDPKIISRSNRRGLNFYYAKVAASIIIIFMVSAVLILTFFDNLKNATPELNYVTKTTAIGEKLKFKLPDGTAVHLNSASTVKYPNPFPEGNREVFLTGEAFFDVKRDTQSSFTIHNDNVRTTALEIQLFFASEARWWPSPEPREQEILMVRSHDNGLTWSSAEQVAFIPNTRDGMPVPLLLQNNKGIVLAIENVGLPNSPWILYSTVAQRWNYPDLGTVQNGRRWLATSGGMHGGGPYLVQLPTGEILLSCHIAGGRNIPGWRKNTMAVFIGDDEAKNFRDRSYPWPDLPVNKGAIFNSLFVKDDSTIVALASRIYGDGHGEIY